MLEGPDSFHDAVDDKADLVVVVVAVLLSSGAAGSCDSGANCLVGKVAANLCGQLVVAGEEDGLLVLAEAIEVTLGAFGEKEAAAAGDLEAFVDELVLVGVGNEAEVDP